MNGSCLSELHIGLPYKAACVVPVNAVVGSHEDAF